MAQVLKVKRSAVAGRVPQNADLQLGEIAINTFDGKMYFKMNNGSDTVIDVIASAAAAVGNGFILKTGDTMTGPLNISTSSNTMMTINTTNSTGGFLRFQNSGTSYADIGSAAQITTTGGALGDFGLNARTGNLIFSTNQVERLRINQSGNVIAVGTVTAAGFIGTVTGHSTLDLPLTGGTLTGALSVSFADPHVTIQSGALESLQLGFNNSGVANAFGIPYLSNYLATASHNLIIGTGNKTRVTIGGGTDFDELVVGNTTAAFSTPGRGNISVYGSTDAIIALGNATTTANGAYVYLESIGKMHVFNAVSGGTIDIGNTGGVVTIDGAGNFGVGTSTPSAKVDVHGDIVATGRIVPGIAYRQVIPLSGLPANTYIQLIPNGTLVNGALYNVTVRWDHTTSGNPFVVGCAFQLFPVNTNGSAPDQPFTAPTSTHLGTANFFTFRTNSTTTSSSGLQCQFNWTGDGNIVVTAYQIS